MCIRDSITADFRDGFLSESERYNAVLKTWEKATNDVTKALQAGLDRYNPIFMMADSGARGSMSQIRQLAGMRGLLANLSLIHILHGVFSGYVRNIWLIIRCSKGKVKQEENGKFADKRKNRRETLDKPLDIV